MENSKKLISLSENDNVLVVCKNIESGEILTYNNSIYKINHTVLLGHKIAMKDIRKGEQILKFNMSIGSAIVDIMQGEHVHIHNIKSDFIPTYTIENQNLKFE